jgi:hypothetical protein
VYSLKGEARMPKKWIGLLIVLVSLAAALGLTAVGSGMKEASALLIGMAICYALSAIVRSIFTKRTDLHSPLLYYTAWSFALTLGWLVYTVLTPSPWLSQWGVKLLVSIVASVIAVPSVVLLARSMKVKILPWERENHNRR